jgi:CelD/BcsL family acetyltransferase involved in cellulose biosynthesis
VFEMLRLEVLRPSELSDADIGAWRALCASRPEFKNPLLGPDFAIAVGALREDARVAVWREGDKPIGFLAYHHRPGGMARPIGAPMSDYHGLVADRPLDIHADLAEFGLSAFRFTGLIDPNGDFSQAVAGENEAYVIELDRSAEAYLETLRAASAKRFKNYRRLDGKLDREVGALTLRAPDHDRAAFDQLLAWKREQLARTGAHDFLAPDWTRELLASFLEMREGHFQGLMINLYCGDKLLAGHIGVRVGDVYHPWIASTDPEMGAWSPGQLFLLRAIAAMPELGLKTYDLGPGHDHYKRPYALTTKMIGEGMMAAAGPRGRAAGASEKVWTLAGAHGAGPVGRLRRRLDMIATTELSLAGRAKGLAGAIAARALRPGASSAEAA